MNSCYTICECTGSAEICEIKGQKFHRPMQRMLQEAV